MRQTLKIYKTVFKQKCSLKIKIYILSLSNTDNFFTYKDKSKSYGDMLYVTTRNSGNSHIDHRLYTLLIVLKIKTMHPYKTQ